MLGVLSGRKVRSLSSEGTVEECTPIRFTESQQFQGEEMERKNYPWNFIFILQSFVLTASKIGQVVMKVASIQSFWLFFGPICGIILYLSSSITNMEESARAMVGVLLWMAVWWLSEPLPIAVTSLIPLAFYPSFGIMNASGVSKTYVNDTIILFVGSFLVALAIEKYKVHNRIAIKLLLLLGSNSNTGKMDPRFLLLGFCLGPGFISMWISNTATAIMMIPLAVGILEKLQGTKEEQLTTIPVVMPSQNDNSNTPKSKLADYAEVEMSPQISDKNNFSSGKSEKETILGRECLKEDPTSTSDIESCKENLEFPEESSEKLLLPPENEFQSTQKKDNSQELQMKTFCKGVVLSIAYSCSIGGMATIIGTGPNLVLSGMWKSLFPEAPPITFLSWFLFGVPLSLAFIYFLWIFVCLWYCPEKAVPIIASSLNLNVLHQEYSQLGPISFAEWAIMIDFGVMALLWMTRDLGGSLFGWNYFFGGKVEDGTVAIFAAFLLFMIPSGKHTGEKILSWKMVGEMPWDVVLLLGGGFAVSSGVTSTGLSDWLGSRLQILKGLPTIFLVPTVASLVVFCTEFTSNAATATVFLPLLAHVALSIGKHPLLLLLPATCAASFAFMLPIATPPNAIAYSTGFLSMADMAAPGMVLNVFGVILLTFWVWFCGGWIWDLDEPVSEIPWLKTNLTSHVP